MGSTKHLLCTSGTSGTGTFDDLEYLSFAFCIFLASAFASFGAAVRVDDIPLSCDRIGLTKMVRRIRR